MADRSPRRTVRPLRHLGVGLLLIALALPILPLAVWSVSFRWFYPDVVPSVWSLEAWVAVLSPANNLAAATADTVAVASLVTVLATLIGVPAGRALGLNEFPGKRVVELLILAPIVVPGVAVALGIHGLFIRYGIANSRLGVAVVHLVPTVPYLTLLVSGVFANFDTDYELQARSLGASALATQRFVTLPAVGPGVAVGALFTFLISSSQYVLTLLIGGGEVVTLPLLLFSFARSGENAIAGALSLVYIAPGVVALWLSSRHLSGNSAALGGLQKL